MLLTIEKVAYLKAVDIFADTPDYLLAAVARITDEVELGPDETFIDEGEISDSMYIVVDGEVRVHSQGQTILTRGQGEVVGELALLDPEPRSASVTSVGEVLLFRIEKLPFDEVMADRPEISQGVIRMLSKRLREQGRLFAESGRLTAEVGNSSQENVS